MTCASQLSVLKAEMTNLRNLQSPTICDNLWSDPTARIVWRWKCPQQGHIPYCILFILLVAIVRARALWYVSTSVRTLRRRKWQWFRFVFIYHHECENNWSLSCNSSFVDTYSQKANPPMSGKKLCYWTNFFHLRQCNRSKTVKSAGH